MVDRGAPQLAERARREDGVQQVYELLNSIAQKARPTDPHGECHQTDPHEDAFGRWIEKPRDSPDIIHYHEASAPFALRNWRLGVHIPSLIIERLVATQQYDLALKVISLVFDPSADGSLGNSASAAVEKWATSKSGTDSEYAKAEKVTAINLPKDHPKASPVLGSAEVKGDFPRSYTVYSPKPKPGSAIKITTKGFTSEGVPGDSLGDYSMYTFAQTLDMDKDWVIEGLEADAGETFERAGRRGHPVEWAQV